MRVPFGRLVVAITGAAAWLMCRFSVFGAAASPSAHYTKEAQGWSAVVEARPCKG